MKKTPLIVLLCLILNNILFAQNMLTIQEVNQKLGKGVNMGNMFEAPTETEWGNPFKDDYFEKIAKLGFNHVRVPIRWDVPNRTSLTEPYTINPVFLERIKFVIDKALSNKLYVIINMHHHEEIFTNPANVKARFLSQWTQIANYFKGYDQRLVFEIMNEPHDKLTPELWNTYFNEALQTVRKTNPTRAVLIGPGDYNGLSAVAKLQIPDDKNLILSIHYYNPFSFTHQGAEWVSGDAQKWLGTKWEDLTYERNQVINEFDFMKNFAKQKNIPVHIGEFGAYSKADLASRVRWTTFLARWFEEQNFSWAYWEFSAGFGIYDPATSQYNTSLVDALIKNPMPLPKQLPTKSLYTSDFMAGNDGWSLGVQPTASGTLARINGGLNIDVKTSTKDTWFVQLTKNNIPLENKKRYLVTCRAYANKAVSVTNYMAKASSPYNSYSGFPSFDLSTTEKAFSYIFTMSEPSDPVARMSFDLGANIANITISSVRVEEILDNVIAVLASEPTENSVIYPNPTNDSITIDGINAMQSLQLFDEMGKILLTKKPQGESSVKVDLRSFPAGIYYILIHSEKEKITKKIVKL